MFDVCMRVFVCVLMPDPGLVKFLNAAVKSN